MEEKLRQHSVLCKVLKQLACPKNASEDTTAEDNDSIYDDPCP